MSELVVDPRRKLMWADVTGFFVRARDGERGPWLNADIAQLDRASLIAWLRADGGLNRRAESVLLRLFSHDMLEADE